MNRLVFAMLAVAGFICTTALANPISPTGDADIDTAAIQNAINAAPSGTVTLGSGTFALNKAIAISNGASLVGGGNAPSDVVLSLVTQTAEDGDWNVLVISNSASTVVSNLTVTTSAANVTNGFGPKSGINMNSGLVVDCVIRDCKTHNNAYPGGGINMAGGTVRRCLVVGCDAFDTGGGGQPGEGIYMTDGLVENCKITGNGMSGYGSAGFGGAVCIRGKGTLRGCLIAGNRNRVCGTGVTIVGPNVDKGEPRCIVENCTIVGNRRNQTDSQACGVYVAKDNGASKSFNVVLRNNIVWGNLSADGVSEVNYNLDYMDDSSSTVEGNDTRPALVVGQNNISVDPEFVDAANGDYHAGYTFCSDAGFNQDWMVGAVDLDGNARILNSVVDMGCYEGETPSGFACRMSLTSDEVPNLATVALVCGCTVGTVDYAEWTFTRQEGMVQAFAHGSSTTIQLGPGTWDVYLVVSSGQQSAQITKTGAVVVQSTKVYANVNGSGEFPYDTVEKGLPSIAEALEKLGPDGTLYVAAGNYVISNGIRIVEGACSRIVSLEGPERTVVRLADTDNLNVEGNYGLYVDNREAYVAGLTFVAGRQGPYYSGTEYDSYGLVTIKADGAIVTNCVFRDLKKGTAQTIHSGVGLDISAGTVSDCLFARVDAYTSGGNAQYGGVIRITGGLVDRVRVEECWMAAHSGYDPRGSGDVVGVYNGGVLRNSLVMRCSSNHGAPIFVGGLNGGTGGYAVNCTFVSNTNEQEKAEHVTLGAFNHAGGLQVGGGSVTNCIVVDNWSVFRGAVSNIYNTAGAAGIGYTLVDDRAGDATFVTAENHNITVAPGANLFRRPDSGDYSLATGSPAINVGLKFDWMETALDLAGSPRIVSRIPDLGCYEAKPSHFSVRIR